MLNAQIHHSKEAMEIDLEMYLSTIRMETGETLEFFLVLLRLKRGTSHKIIHTANKEVINNNSALRRSENQPMICFTCHEQIFPQNNEMSSNVVRFTTTDDTINELSEVCPLNYYGLRTRTLINLGFPELASIASTSTPETRKKLVVLRLNLCWIQEPPVQSIISEPYLLGNISVTAPNYDTKNYESNKNILSTNSFYDRLSNYNFQS